MLHIYYDNYIVRPYTFVTVITNSVTRKIIQEKIIVVYLKKIKSQKKKIKINSE